MPQYGTPSVDFLIQDTKDPKFIAVQDITEYFFTKSKPAIIEICPPGTNNPVVHYLRKRAVNVFNSNNLYMNCPECEDNYIDLPDGIWTITVKISPDTFQKKKYYLKMDRLRLDFGKILIDNNSESKEFIDWFTRVYLYMNKAAAATQQGDLQTAKRFYDSAKSLVDKNKECKNCF